MKPGPTELIYSWEEGQAKIRELVEDLMKEMGQHRNKVAIKRVKVNLELIRQGRHTSWELAAAVRKIIKTMEDDRLKKLYEKLGNFNYLEAENFFQLMDDEYQRLPEELQKRVTAELDRILIEGEGFDQTSQRIQNTILVELYPAQRKEFNKKKRDVFFQTEHNTKVRGYGRSMLPTMPFRSSFLATPTKLRTGTPLITARDIKRGDIVTAVMCSPKLNYGWQTSWVTKRVVGLPGDRVRDQWDRELTVGGGHCWLVGDNLKESGDSRHFGSFPLSSLRSRVDEILPESEPGFLEEPVVAKAAGAVVATCCFFVVLSFSDVILSSKF